MQIKIIIVLFDDDNFSSVIGLITAFDSVLK
jgi:hypothetical protein